MTDKQQVFMRAYPASIEQTGPRQLTGRLVPYDEVADVLDELDDGRFDIYREGFRRGSFEGQVVTGARNKGVLTKIGLIHRHEGGLGYLGPCVSLRDEADGLWGDVTVLPSKGDDVEALLRAGVDELSVEFRLRPGENTVTDSNGVRWRTRAHLDQIALEPKGAYRSAQVLAYRSEQDEIDRQAAELAQTEQADEQRLAAEAAELEATAAATLQRKEKWDELVSRIPDLQRTQQELVTEYGITRVDRPIR